MCEWEVMGTGTAFEVSVANHVRLEAVEDRNSPQKHVWRVGVILATADGAGTVCCATTSRIPLLDPDVVLRKVVLWLDRYPGRIFHLTPASCS